MSIRRKRISALIEHAGQSKLEMIDLRSDMEGAADEPEELEELAEEVLEILLDLQGFVDASAGLAEEGLGAELKKSKIAIESQLDRAKIQNADGLRQIFERAISALEAEMQVGRRQIQQLSSEMAGLREKIRERVDCSALLKKALESLDLELQERRSEILDNKDPAGSEPELPALNAESLQDQIERHRKLDENYAEKRRRVERLISQLDNKFKPEQRDLRKAEHKRLEEELKRLEREYHDEEKQIQAAFRASREAPGAKSPAKPRTAERLADVEREFSEKKSEAQKAFLACQAYRKELLETGSEDDGEAAS